MQAFVLMCPPKAHDVAEAIARMGDAAVHMHEVCGADHGPLVRHLLAGEDAAAKAMSRLKIPWF